MPSTIKTNIKAAGSSHPYQRNWWLLLCVCECVCVCLRACFVICCGITASSQVALKLCGVWIESMPSFLTDVNTFIICTAVYTCSKTKSADVWNFSDMWRISYVCWQYSRVYLVILPCDRGIISVFMSSECETKFYFIGWICVTVTDIKQIIYKALQVWSRGDNWNVPCLKKKPFFFFFFV